MSSFSRHEKAESMNTQLTVPASFVSYLRSGLFREWGFAAEDIANLSIEFGGGAPDGAFSEPLQTFFTMLVIFSEVGWKDSHTQGEIVINLNIGGAYIARALKHQHQALANELGEIPKETREEMRAAAAARIAEFGAFVQEVDAQVRRLNRRQGTSAIIHAASGSPFPSGAARQHRFQH
jgi:hypothetical protein